MSPPAEQKLYPSSIPRHRHNAGYAALVLDGQYIERGSSGRWHVEPGDIVAHGNFEAHDNAILGRHAWILNIPLPPALKLPPVFRVSNFEELVFVARKSPKDAIDLLKPNLVCNPIVSDWPDILAQLLRETPIAINMWAKEAGIAESSVSRGFRKTYGIPPSQYRIEAQLLKAINAIFASKQPLSQIAFECGFSDQAHFSRRVRAMTGHSPMQLRDVNFIQD
jgi:AraC-like DNA-binding protein